MGMILGVLVVLLVSGLIASGIMYSRQQALADREQRIRALKQKFEELQALFDIIFTADSKPDISIVLNQGLIEIARDIRALDRSNAEAQALLNSLTSRDTALREGMLLPKGQHIMNSEAALSTLLSSYAAILQRLQRFKVRGSIAAHQYEEFSLYLRQMTLTTELDSHMANAETLLKDNDRLRAINHLKHCRELLKKTNLEIEDKNERIRELSDKIKFAESETEAEANAQSVASSTNQPRSGTTS